MKKQILIAFGLGFALILIVLVIKPPTTGFAVHSEMSYGKIKLGYCPTMSGIAEEIKAKNPQISLVAYDFTFQALQSLNNNEVDIILVGRLAKEKETGEIFERRLRDGLTTIGKEKRYISIDEMRNTKIHTYIDKRIILEYVENLDNVVIHSSLESAIDNGINDIVLIQWSDFSDDLELVIPVDNNMNKIEKFRIPVLYSYDKIHIKNLEI